jgi:hypothetical protein
MKGNVSEIHGVCHDKKNVSKETDTHFVSGWWSIDKKHIRSGVVFALHESKNEESYLQGEIEGLEEERGGKKAILVRKSNTRMPWSGGGTGVLGYKWI